MKLLIILIAFLLIKIGHPKSLQELYPDGLLTDDYGILSEADLLKDIKNGNPMPYDRNVNHPGYNRWQCFPTAKVKYTFEKWRDRNPWGGDKIIDLCEFSFEYVNNGIMHIFYGRTAKGLGHCQEVGKRWKQLIKNQTHICLCGSGNLTKNNETYWVWIKYKTKNGCDSWFDDECETD